MKTVPVPSVLSPAVIVLGLLTAAVVAVSLSSKQMPALLQLLSSLRVSIVVLLVLGMAACAMGGIGRVAATQAWAHPLSIVGYILGAALLVIAAAIFFHFKLPLMETDRQAFVFFVALLGAKVVVSVIHSVISR